MKRPEVSKKDPPYFKDRSFKRIIWVSQNVDYSKENIEPGDHTGSIHNPSREILVLGESNG